MQRLAQFDVTRQFLSPRGKFAAQIAFAGICSAAMIGLRTAFDLWAPTSGPFALIYPTVLLVTLYGHWQSGVVALVLTFLWAWYFVLPDTRSFAFSNPADEARVLLNALCCMIVIVFAEAFRRAARSTVDEIKRAADRRLVLLADLEHRTKNNFALVASMLEIQKRNSNDERLHSHLEDAAGRVRTFADAYSELALEQADDVDVELKPYLEALLDRLEGAALPPNVKLFREIDPAKLPRETAAAIGLYLNEAVSNAVKYAFPDDREGTIGIYFNSGTDGWRLTVEDDGLGVDSKGQNEVGLGSKLMAAFAHQAGGSHSAGPAITGFRAELVCEAEQTAAATR